MAPDVAGAIDTLWEKEEIPDSDSLYMRVHKDYILPNGDLKPVVFRNQPPEKDGGTSMSTDWSKYSSPAATRRRARIAEDNAVIRMNVAAVRRVPRQTVEHSPDVERDNRAHTDVIGPKQNDQEVRVRLLEASEVVIRFDDPVEG